VLPYYVGVIALSMQVKWNPAMFENAGGIMILLMEGIWNIIYSMI